MNAVHFVGKVRAFRPFMYACEVCGEVPIEEGRGERTFLRHDLGRRHQGPGCLVFLRGLGDWECGMWGGVGGAVRSENLKQIATNVVVRDAYASST